MIGRIRLRLPAITVLVFAVSSSGCASWVRHDVVANHDDQFTVAVLPVELATGTARLADIASASATGGDERAMIRRELGGAAAHIGDRLQRRLADSACFAPVMPVPDHPVANSLPAPPHRWDREDFERLGLERPVPAVLRVRLTGYGSIARRWRRVLIGTGIIEGVVQGVVATGLFHSAGVGLAVAAEEIGQEYLVWGGGSYLFNRYYTPVTLEADLIATTDGSQVWHDTVFVSAANRAIRALPAAQRDKKEVRLRVTADRAVAELVDDLARTADRNLAARSHARPTGHCRIGAVG